MAIDRPDWGDGGHMPNALVPSSYVDPDTLPAPADMLAEMEGEQVRTSDGGDPITGLSAFVVDTARHVSEQILADAPSGFTDSFDVLSSGLQRRVFETMAARPNLRGLDLVAAVEDKLTLAEAVEAGNFLRSLPEDCKAWLRGD